MYYIKLTNGDDLVCDIQSSTKDDYTTMINPMKMNTHPALSERGIVETLTLTAWLHPYSDDSSIKVKKSSIVTIAPASAGLISFYRRQLKVFLNNEKALSKKEWEVKERGERIGRRLHTRPTREQYDEILDQLADLESEDMMHRPPIDKKKLH
mgnify:CR=1 FL=1|tara:strand:- start:1004 stop:1462 length:459 start_codon:yes stop_codon:yes gene_type:complete